MKRPMWMWLFAMAVAAICPPAQATLITFNTNLAGANENPVNASPATGIGTVVLDDVLNTITVDLSFTGLVSSATAAHIHGPALPGVNAGVLFPLSGVPNATAGTVPQQVFAITPTQIGQLQSGLFYLNVHSATFPGGEIRGQLPAVPEPLTLGMLAMGLAAFAGARRVRTLKR